MKLFASEMTPDERRRLEYELALREGQRRFGSDCRHEKVKAGRCLNCLRTVITT